MKKADKKTTMDKNETPPVEPPPVPNHTEKIKSQVLAKIGRPPRLSHVEVSRHHGGNYRVNIWEQAETDKNIAVTSGIRIRSSYYLKVSDTGEILQSNPPLDNSCDSARRLNQIGRP